MKNHSPRLPMQVVFHIDFDAIYRREPAMRGGLVYFMLYVLCVACVYMLMCVCVRAHARRIE